MSNNFLNDTQFVFLELTNYCNFSCYFCPHGLTKRPPQHMDTNLAKTVIKQLDQKGYTNNLYFHILGEPLLHPDIFDIIGFASKLRPESILFTNGSLLTDNYIQSMFEANPFEIMISMQYTDEESFNLRGSSMSWHQYLSRIRNTVEYKLTHDTETHLRISVGMRKESPYPQDDYFPEITASNLKSNIVEIFSDIPSLDMEYLKKFLNSSEMPFRGRIELASGVSISVKPMGNWRKIYRDERLDKGSCPYLGKEWGILSDGKVVLCHLDYDGKTAVGNVKEKELESILDDPVIRQEIDAYNVHGTLPKGCQYCFVSYKRVS